MLLLLIVLICMMCRVLGVIDCLPFDRLHVFVFHFFVLLVGGRVVYECVCGGG